MARFKQVFPKAEIKSVGVAPYSKKVNLNFHYDKLFQIILDYKLNNKYKRVIFYIGTDKEHIIGPPELELLNLNNDATILYQE